jgi:hypothetical protein
MYCMYVYVYIERERERERERAPIPPSQAQQPRSPSGVGGRHESDHHQGISGAIWDHQGTFLGQPGIIKDHLGSNLGGLRGHMPPPEIKNTICALLMILSKMLGIEPYRSFPGSC